MLGNVDINPQAHKTIFIRRRSLDHCHIDGQDSSVEQFRHLGQKYRSVIGCSLVHSIPGRFSDKKRIMTEIML